MSKFIEYSFFKSTEANKNFNYWINHEPQSFGGVDLQLFTNMVISVLDNDENLEFSHLNQPKSLLKDFHIAIYMDKYYAMQAIYKELNNRLRIAKP